MSILLLSPLLGLCSYLLSFISLQSLLPLLHIAPLSSSVKQSKAYPYPQITTHHHKYERPNKPGGCDRHCDRWRWHGRPNGLRCPLRLQSWPRQPQRKCDDPERRPGQIHARAARKAFCRNKVGNQVAEATNEYVQE